MMKLEIEPIGLAELKRDLRRLQPRNLLRGELDPLGCDIIRVVSPYPPALPTSRRTGRLGRAWHYNVQGIRLEVKNYAWYAGYVHGEEQTATHRQTGWKRLFDVALTEADKLIKRLADKAGNIWRT